MTEFRDRLLEVLLTEELGHERSPDLRAKILAQAFPRRRRWVRRTTVLAAGLVLIALIVGWATWASRYPDPQASGTYEVVEGTRVARGSTLRTRDQSAVVELGGYCRVVAQPGTLLRIEGKERAEEVHVELGEVRCTVTPGHGAFTVRTPAGVVSVVGTEFTVHVFDAPGENQMLDRRMIVRVLVGAVLVSGSWGSFQLVAGEEKQAPKADAKEEKKSGTIVGVIAAKGKDYLEVKADGEEKARRYVPRWVGGAPKDGGGYDKETVKTIGELKVGTRIKLEWEFEERPRVVKVTVLKAPVKD